MAKKKYNGKILPQIPSWNTTTYPYGIIVFNAETELFSFFIASVVPQFCIWINFGYACEGKISEYQLIDDAWVLQRSGVTVTNFGEGCNLIWGNVDIYDTSGALYLRTSTPQEISSDLNINKKDFLQGLMTKIIGDGVYSDRGRDESTFWLIDFKYHILYENGEKYYVLTEWKHTYKGISSTECIIPDHEKIIIEL